MHQRLMLLNILLPITCLVLLGFLPPDVFLLPDFVVLALVIITLGRAYLLMQQQVVFSVLPAVLLSISDEWQLGLDIFAPFATLCFLFYMWFVNLQWNKKPWFHWLHILNLCILVLFVALAMRFIPIPDWLLNYNAWPIEWLTVFFAITPLFFVTKWHGTGRWASYWPLLMVVGFIFEWSSDSYLYLWAALMPLFSLTLDAYILAYVDELTGILGRRALMFKLNTLGKHYTVVMVDVDHFKLFNDKYGHQVGDDVLKVVAKLIGETSGAVAYRYGGEEFILLFAKGKSVELAPHVEATRERLANYELFPKSIKREKKQRGKSKARKPLHITASFGMACHKTGESIDSVIERADQALYKAKDSGRNCLEIAK